MPLNIKIIDSVNNILINSKTNLLAVTKKRSVEEICDLYKLGIKIFGENRVQEAEKKFTNLNFLNEIELHLIGPLQSNKIKKALKIFDVIQTIDSVKTINLISENLNTNTKTKSFYIQINIGNEIQKSGIFPDKLFELFEFARSKHLNIDGLMCIPPNDSNPKKYFEKMVKARDALDSSLKLSMGMSSDYNIAIDCGTDLIRLGTVLFE